MSADPGLGVNLTEETIFTWGAPPLKFGAGAVDEIGFEMAQYGARRVLILTDPRINELGIPARIADSLTKQGITSEIFDGVHVEPTVHRNHVDIALTGTAVRPVSSKALSAEAVFVSDLSGRDFALLTTSGWAPVGLAVGASFVYAPRRTAGVAIKQKSQNVELTNFTEAMYSARESAMERMQRTAIAMRGSGVVEVKVTEGPMDFAHHAIGFAAYGTVVRLVADAHQPLEVRMVLPLDDPVLAFDATSLRGG